jgi:2-C-methyl-D-erythritol 4-phosphate cytidylyltransferase
MNTALIVAAGRGTRMGGSVSKQYRLLDGQPILRRTMDVFTATGRFDAYILVVAAEDADYCRQRIVASAAIAPRVTVVNGGRERQESVFNGLQACQGRDDDIVLIHDGVRPFVTPAMITQCLKAAQEDGACVIAIPSPDTLKQIGAHGRVVATLPRDTAMLAQTPQGFQLGLIRKAHRQARDDGYHGTDDAQLVERMGLPIRVVPGSRTNLKITTPEDLVLADAIWNLVKRTPAD